MNHLTAIARDVTLNRPVGRALYSNESRTAPRQALRPEVTDRPVVLLGGESNALSLARLFGRRGIKVYAINDAASHVRRSRYVEWIELPTNVPAADAWREYLLGPAGLELAGSVLLACSDAAIQFLARNRGRLLQRFLLDESNPRAQETMLDKLSTYQAAVAAGVATPRFWVVHDRARLHELRDELVYPLLVKPTISHVYWQRFGRKFVTVNSFAELLAAYDVVDDAGIEVMLVERIPGPDSQLCSYYTYLDEDSQPEFHFTKRVIRRYPNGMGTCCYHVTDWVPELIEPALRLFQHVGLRGVANVEFKLDPRDGQLKLIECNARYTAANNLVAAAGYDIGWLVYSRLTTGVTPRWGRFRRGLRLWYPAQDFKSFRELHARGEMSWAQWLRSIARPQMLPFFSFRDPWPTICVEGRRAARRVGRYLGLGS